MPKDKRIKAPSLHLPLEQAIASVCISIMNIFLADPI
jgi:hypothetical protein